MLLMLLNVFLHQDNSGVIENEELSGFLKDLLELVKRDYDNTDLAHFAQTIMKGCDTNRDGKISKKVSSTKMHFWWLNVQFPQKEII